MDDSEMQFSNEEHLSATQKDPDDFIMDTITTGDDVEDDADSKAALPELWGRLVSRGQKSTTYDLRVNVKPAIDEKHHLHSLGRSSECDIRLGSSTRISNRHCVIYCKVNNTDRNHPYYEAYVEDQSTNGTVVNKKYKLVKKVPRLLRSGDEIYLVNPEVVKLLNVPEVEVENSSFVVILYLPANLQKSIYANQKNLRMQPSSSSNGHAITRSTTVVRMLNQNRNIHDFYEFRELLGTGTSGMVYRGIQKDTGRDWAIKVIDIRKFSLSENFNSSNLVNSNDADQAAAAITKEAEMLRSLKHPNIIRLEDIFADQGHNLFLVMELSTGGDLFERILSKRFYTENEARIVMIQLLSGIEYLHSNQVAHRDLKPENVMLVSHDSDVDIKITDFGLAKKLDEKGGLKSFCGTPQYFAPEVLRRQNTVLGLGSYTLAADMWSGSQWNIVSEEAKSFIHELLVLNPDHRLTASQALKHKWITDRNSNLSSSNNLKSGNRDRRKSVGVESKSKIELDMSLIYSKDASKVFSIDTGSTEAKKKTSMDTYQTSSTVSSHDIGDFKDRSGSLMQQLKLGALDIDDFKKCAIERSSSNDSINTRSTEPSDPQDLEIHHEDIEENTLNAKTFISPVNNNSTVIEGGNIRRPYRTRSSTKNGLVAQLGSEEKVTKIPWPITNGKHGEGTGVNKESGVTPNSRKRRQSVAMSTAAKKRRSSSTGRKSKTNPQKQGQIDIFFGKG